MTGAVSSGSLESGTLVAWLQKMVEIRLAEDKVTEIYMQGLVPGSVHLCQGQEAVSVGACGALTTDDWLVCTYRGHHHALSRGWGSRRSSPRSWAGPTGSAAGWADPST